MGERRQGILFRPEFNRAVRVQASRSVVTGDAGTLVRNPSVITSSRG